jgi:hypothetical protein
LSALNESGREIMIPERRDSCDWASGGAPSQSRKLKPFQKSFEVDEGDSKRASVRRRQRRMWREPTRGQVISSGASLARRGTAMKSEVSREAERGARRGTMGAGLEIL